MKTEPVEEFCKNDAAPLVRECPDCIDKFIFLAKQYEAENVKFREALEKIAKIPEWWDKGYVEKDYDLSFAIETAQKAIVVPAEGSK